MRQNKPLCTNYRPSSREVFLPGTLEDIRETENTTGRRQTKLELEII